MCLLKEYRKNKENHEDFLEWLLVRKLSTRGKLVLFSFLWILFLKFAYNVRVMVFFFEFVFIAVTLFFMATGLYRMAKKWYSSKCNQEVFFGKLLEFFSPFQGIRTFLTFFQNIRDFLPKEINIALKKLIKHAYRRKGV
ncbi:hypothetical protein [Enterococcus italicus]|uniref:hypothetical protein n=1 Tax=Enterococcus italicus TaxID=246144 RepID=UPI003F481588